MRWLNAIQVLVQPCSETAGKYYAFILYWRCFTHVQQVKGVVSGHHRVKYYLKGVSLRWKRLYITFFASLFRALYTF
jgi:hypothetical protein